LSGPAGAALGGAITAKAVQGVAKFTNISMNLTGTYQLKATDGTLTVGKSGSITISPSTAAKLVITQQPTTGKAGLALGAIVVKIEDTFGNVVATSAAVSLSIVNGPTGATISGNKVNAIKGIATFNAVKLSKTGAYTLKAIEGVLVKTLPSSIQVS